jgi:tetratricopeptide (TPR) repeat protein
MECALVISAHSFLVDFMKIRNCIFCFVSLLFFACQSKLDKKEEPTAAALPDELLVINQKINGDPKNADNYNLRAAYFFKQNDLASASKDILDAITLDSTKSEFYVTLSDIFFASGKSAQSKRSLEKSLQLDGENKEALLRMAELYLYVKDNKKSIEYLDKVLKIDMNLPKAYFIKGMNFKELGDTAKAISSFQTTIEQDVAYYNAYVQLGLLYAAKRNPLALKYYENALKIDPKSVEALYNTAMFLQENNQLNKAIEVYTQLLKVDPQNKYANYNLGYIHYEYLKVYSEAVKHFSNAMACDSRYAEAVYMRGLCFEAMGDVQKASADYNLALTIAPGYDKPMLGLQRLAN